MVVFCPFGFCWLLSFICFFLISTARKQRSCDELKFIPASYQHLNHPFNLAIVSSSEMYSTLPLEEAKQGCVNSCLWLFARAWDCREPACSAWGAVRPQGSCFTSSCHPSGCPHALSALRLSAQLIALWVGSRAGGAGCSFLQDCDIMILLFTCAFLGVGTEAVSWCPGDCFIFFFCKRNKV